MNEPWTPYGGAPQGVDPEGVIPGLAGWLLVLIGLSIVGVSIFQISACAEGLTRAGVHPANAGLLGLVVSFVPLVGSFLATYGAVAAGSYGLGKAILLFFWPYLALIALFLSGLLHTRDEPPEEDPDAAGGEGEQSWH